MVRKRIVVCADGTWNDPEDKYPTNVLRVARAVRPQDQNGVQQIVYYDWGVGSYYAPIRGGVSGLGIMKNIQDCYRFIVQNFDDDDQLFLFGFSRGAYTVRALAGFLNKCGILPRHRAAEIPEAFEFYKKTGAKPRSGPAKKWRKSRRVKAGRVHFIGVWDTVGALGIPTRVLAFVDERDLFYDAEIGSKVECARHAVAIDEKRGDFSPTLWAPRDGVDLKQVWFAGVHADVGGGYKPDRNSKRLSDIPLEWMAKEASKRGLELEGHLYTDTREWFDAGAHRSYKSFWRALGRAAREMPADAVVHQSVQRRNACSGYEPDPLKNWLTVNKNRWQVEPW